MTESKKQLREEMLASFAQLSEEEHSKISNQLQQRLFQSGLWENAKTIAVYLSVRNEWDTRKIVEQAWEDGKKVAIPKTIPDTKEMFFYEIPDWSQTVKGPFQLEEPNVRETNCVKKEAIELMIVPGLVFTNEGYRIGFGGGYYDRYLADFVHPTASLVHTNQLTDTFSIEPFDIPISYLITEQGIIG